MYNSVRREGQVVPNASGTHTFALQTSGGVRLSVGGKIFIDALTTSGRPEKRGRMGLEAGKPVPVVSTLDIVENLSADPSPAGVARKLLCNYTEYAE